MQQKMQRCRADTETARFCGALLRQIRVHTLRVYCAAKSCNELVALTFMKLISQRGTGARSDSELPRTISQARRCQEVSDVFVWTFSQ